jgi:recombination protein RecA
VALDVGTVDKKGAWIQFQGELIGQGKDAARKTLAEKPELAKKIQEATLAKRLAELTAATATTTPATPAGAR